MPVRIAATPAPVSAVTCARAAPPSAHSAAIASRSEISSSVAAFR